MFHFGLYRLIINTKHAFHVDYSHEGEAEQWRGLAGAATLTVKIKT